jgi:prolyl-tRNA synthetase
MFAEMELIGIPHRVTVGERALKDGAVEYFDRRTQQTTAVPLAEAYGFTRGRLSGA